MKTITFSLCTGVALLGSIACGNSNTPGGSGVSTGGTGQTPVVTGGTGHTTPIVGSGGSGSGLAVVDPGTAGGSSGPNACQPGNTTTISGIVKDPAGKNPLYNISVFVADPNSPLPDLEKAPVSCGCTQLLPEKVLAIGAPTDATGHFEIPCAPSGNVTLVVQTGKWRRKYENVNIVKNQPNVIPDLRLPANSSEGNLPNIAISTGGSDSFECLPLRIGVSASEYVGGSATGGHIHIYTGLRGATPPTGTVESYNTLWDSEAHLKEHDVVILSCEGGETRNGPATGGGTFGGGGALTPAVQQNLMNYVNAGGRVFASHYHYAWFSSGPFNMGANKLATWAPGPGTIGNDMDAAYPAEINTTLSTGAAFPGGTALAKWLGVVNALDSKQQLPVRYVRNNVGALAQPPSTEWIHLAPGTMSGANASQYFSADTPIGSDKVCGRVVYSALHVSGGPGKSDSGKPEDADYPTGAGGATGTGAGGGGGRPGGMMGGGVVGQTQGGTVPSGCAKRALTPQELALEFMFFDLSSCLVPVGEEPTVIPK